MAKTEILLIRHGETEWNIQGRMQGQMDSPLTPAGVAQAAALGQRLRDESFSHIYSSDLGRAFATASAVAQVTGHSICVDPRLREKHMGILEGLTWRETSERFPEIIAGFERRDPDYAIPGGESNNQMLARTMAFLDEIAEQHHGGRVAAVTHGAVLSMLIRHILGIPPEIIRRYHIHNTSIHEIAKEDGVWWVHSFGDIRHTR